MVPAMVKKTLVALGCILAVVTSIVVGRTLIMGVSPTPPPSAPAITLDSAGAADRLAQAIRLRTISWGPDAPTEDEAFRSMQVLLEHSFPRIQSTLSRDIVNGDSLLYRWQGSDPALAPILLIAHMDVVPGDMGTTANWTHGPFSGDVADGYIWGRGTLDDKSAVMGALEAVEYLLGQGVTPKRSVYLAFGHDEELDGAQGAAKIVALLNARGIKFDFSLDEGLTVLVGMVPGLSPPAALIGVTEKGYLSLQLTAEGEGGHVSMPPLETSVGRLAKAIARLEAHQMPAALQPPASTMLDDLAPRTSFWTRLLVANRWLFGPLLMARLEASPETNALIRTTTAPTLFTGGIKENVLPGDARATVNFRLLPGDSIDDVMTHVRTAIDDPLVRVEPIGIRGEAPPLADVEGRGFALLSRTIGQIFPDAVVAPGLVLAGTDSVNYAPLVQSSYRFLPVALNAEDLGRVHGVDERISIANYERLIRFYVEFLRNATSE
jgi:carboxypeptidase PM20D1